MNTPVIITQLPAKPVLKLLEIALKNRERVAVKLKDEYGEDAAVFAEEEVKRIKAAIHEIANPTSEMRDYMDAIMKMAAGTHHLQKYDQSTTPTTPAKK